MEIDLTAAVGYLFNYNPTYSNLNITRRIMEDYNIEYLTLTTRFIKRIRLK
jgi:hypothetical protein